MATTPDQNTQWVACAAVNIALRRLATNLAAHLAGVPLVDGRPHGSGRDMAARLLGDIVNDAPLDLNWTDLDPGAYDADEAQRIALEMLGDIIADIRRDALL